jgi:hypothetical protein
MCGAFSVDVPAAAVASGEFSGVVIDDAYASTRGGASTPSCGDVPSAATSVDDDEKEHVDDDDANENGDRVGDKDGDK